MKDIRRTAALVSVLLAMGIVPASAQGMMGDAPPPPLPAGTRAPNITTATVNSHGPVSLPRLRGKVVLVDYWATWCGPCQMATPTLQSLHQKFAKKGLVVLGMDTDAPDTVKNVPSFLKHFGVTYPIAVLSRANIQSARAYHVDGIPAQFLIDKKGIVRWSQSGYAPGEGAELSAMITHLLAEKG